MLTRVKLSNGRVVAVDSQRLAVIDGAKQMIAGLINDGTMTVQDAGEALSFVVAQLAYTEAQTFERFYTPMQYEELLPITFEAGEYADSIRYEIYDFAGRGKRHSGKGRDINLVDVAYADESFPVYNGNIGYDYSQEELRRTAFLRRPINERKIQAAVEGYRRHMNAVGLFGEDDLTGLFNSASVPQGAAPTGAWATATVAQILADINTMLDNIWTQTAFNDNATTVVMSPLKYSFLANTPRSDNSDMTILEYVKKNNISKATRGIEVDFMPGYGLDTAGVGATHRMMAYVKNPIRLIMHIPLPLRFLAPQLLGLSVEVPGEYKYSGVEFRYPQSAFYMDGI